MSAAKHTPGRVCDACEGFCLQPVERRAGAGVEISLRIGQRVRHQEDYQGKRVTGVVRGLSIDSEGVLMADIALDVPIVIPRSSDIREISIWRQYVPAHELAPFDDRDELAAELLASLHQIIELCAVGDVDEHTDALGWGGAIKSARAAIAKATGSAA